MYVKEYSWFVGSDGTVYTARQLADKTVGEARRDAEKLDRLTGAQSARKVAALKATAHANTVRARWIKVDLGDGRTLASHGATVPTDGTRYDFRAHVAPTVDASAPFTGIDAPDILRLVDGIQRNRDSATAQRRRTRQATAVVLGTDGAGATHRATTDRLPTVAQSEARGDVSEAIDRMAQTSPADVHASQMRTYRDSRPVRVSRVSKWVRIK